MINYFLVSFLAYSGLFIGMSLAFIAKEEIKPGRKYFVFLKKILLSLIIVFLFALNKLDYIIILLALAIVLVYFYKLRVNKGFKEDFLIYLIFGAIFYLSYKNTNLFVIESSLMFLYGFPTGTLLVDFKSKWRSLFEILKNIGFLIISSGLPFLFSNL